MKWFRNLKIGSKLLFAFTMVALLAAFVGAVGIGNLHYIQQQQMASQQKYTAPMQITGALSVDFQKIRILMRDMIIAQDIAEIQKIEGQVKEYRADMDQQMDLFYATIDVTSDSPETIKAFNELNNARKNYGDYIERLQPLAEANLDAEAYALMRGDMAKAAEAEQEAIDRLTTLKLEAAQQAAEKNGETAALAMKIMLGTIAAALLLALFHGIFVSRQITRPIKQVLKAAEQLAVGDAAISIDYRSNDEIGEMVHVFKKMVENIKGQANITQHIAAGDLAIEVKPRSEADVMGRSLAEMLAALQQVNAEICRITEGIRQGKVDTRGDTTLVQGNWQTLIASINELVEAFAEPIGITAACIKRIARGEMPDRLKGEALGDFNEVKENLNACIGAINLLIEDARLSSEAAIEGRLDYRIDPTPHLGDFKAIVNGMNGTLDALVGHINSIPLPLFIIDSAFNIQFINDAATRMIGATQVEGRKCYEYFRTDHCQTEKCVSGICMRNNMPARSSTQASPRDQQYDLEYMASPIKDNHGQTIGALEIMVDQSKIAEARRIAQSIAQEIGENTRNLQTSARDLLNVAQDMTAHSEETRDRSAVATSAVEEITATIESTARASAEASANIGQIASAVEEMSSTIRNMASAAEQMSAGVNQTTQVMEEASSGIKNVVTSAEEVSKRVYTVASSVKDMNVSLTEVSQNCEHSRRIASNAEIRAHDTNGIIDRLALSSRQIGKIVGVINNIADQTNMLALNAAIEAAGAGEAGKGFAVVATEVKELAKQTAVATDEISEQIEAMQTNMSDAVSAVGEINRVIEEITQITSTIAAAVTQQSATVGGISDAIVVTADRVGIISTEIAEMAQRFDNISQSTREASNGVRHIARSAAELSVASGEVSRNTDEASQRVANVARASLEVSKGAGEISQVMVNIRQAAESTTNGAESTSGAARELTGIAEQLDDLMSRLRI